MIEFDVLDTRLEHLDWGAFDVFSDAQEITEAGKSKKTLEDFLDKIEFNTVKQKEGGYAFHVRTKPVKKERDWLSYLPSFGIWRYAFGIGTSIDSYFGIDMEGMKSRVVETRTKDGVVLDIFGNVDREFQFEILKDSYYSDQAAKSKDSDSGFVKAGKLLWNVYKTFRTGEPSKDSIQASRNYTVPDKKSDSKDPGRKMRDFAGVLEKLGQVYEKLGVSEGRLVLSPELFTGQHINANLDFKLLEKGSVKNCTFYDVMLPQTEIDDDFSDFRKSDEKKKPKIYKPSDSNSKSKESGKVDSGNITFKDVIGLEDQVKKLRNAIKYFKDPEGYKKERGFGLSSGCILYGPPGTGKTHLAKAFANEAGVPLMVYDASNIFGKYVGDSEAAVKEMFEDAKKQGKCVIFIDEFDQLAKSRNSGGHEVSGRVVNLLLTYIQGFSDRGDIYVMGATNNVGDIDAALRSSKGGRLEEIEIGPPNYEARKAMIKKAVADHKKRVKDPPFTKLDYNRIAEASEGLVGRQLINQDQSILRSLCDQYYDAKDEGKKPSKLTTQDWIKEIEKYIPKKGSGIGFGK